MSAVDKCEPVHAPAQHQCVYRFLWRLKVRFPKLRFVHRIRPVEASGIQVTTTRRIANDIGRPEAGSPLLRAKSRLLLRSGVVLMAFVAVWALLALGPKDQVFADTKELAAIYRDGALELNIPY